MHIINLASSCTLTASMLLITGPTLAQTTAHTAHHGTEMTVATGMNMTDPVEEQQQMEHQHEQQDHARETTAMPTQPLAMPVSMPYVTEHEDHQQQHGRQIYQRTIVESRWLRNEDGQGQLKSELDTRIGTDENKLVVKIHQDKAESEQSEYDAKLMYSRMISTFWDAQAGVRYQHQPQHHTDQDKYDAVFGIHGLAPYFFETDAYFTVGKDQQIALSLETERDLLLTQKLILKPYLDLNVVLSDDSDYAQKTGFSSVQAGIETRYEINKQLMPFVDVGYAYSKGQQLIPWQQATDAEKSWFYGAGLRFKF